MSPPRGSDEAIHIALDMLEACKGEFQREKDHGHSPTPEKIEKLELAIDNAENQLIATNRDDQSIKRLLNTLLDCREDVARTLALGGGREGRNWAIRAYDTLLERRESAQSKTSITTCNTRQDLAMLLCDGTDHREKERAAKLVVFNLREGPGSFEILRSKDRLAKIEELINLIWSPAKFNNPAGSFDDLSNAATLAKRSIQILEHSLGPSHVSTIDIRGFWVAILIDQAKHPLARSDYKESALSLALKLARENVDIIKKFKKGRETSLETHQKYIEQCQLLSKEIATMTRGDSPKTPTQPEGEARPRITISKADSALAPTISPGYATAGWDGINPTYQDTGMPNPKKRRLDGMHTSDQTIAYVGS